MKLTPENYHSKEACQEYFSVSQYKAFVGTYGRRGCEAKALAELKGDWTFEQTPSMLVGSYVDAHFEGTLDVFKAQNPEIFTKTGELKSSFEGAMEVIARAERDPYFMKFLSGEKQVIVTGSIFGVPWKGKVDSLIKDALICDLKVMKEIREALWVKDLGRVSFVEYWGYSVQGAVYQELVRQALGKKLPFFLAALSKEKYPDLEIIGFQQKDLDDALSLVLPNVLRIKDLKEGKVQPDRCEECDFCRATKVLTRPLHFSELILK